MNWCRVICLCFFIGWGRESLQAQVVISEFLASNSSSIRDEDGESSDWIELFNLTTNSVDIAGWHLTDNSTNSTAWTFPSPTVIPGNAFLIVFASGKNRTVSGAELHTSFALNRNGEYLALVKSDLSTATEFTPAFPEVQEDEAFGYPMSSMETVVVAEFDPVKYFTPTDDSLGTTWTSVDFDDATWTNGNAAVGYERSGTNYQPLLNSLIPIGSIGVYTRFNFTLNSIPPWSSLTLKMKYDDGFVGYLNGVFIDSANAPANPVGTSTATADHPDAQAASFEPFDANHLLPHLNIGTNTLAIHGLNRNSGSSDFLVLPELVAGESNIDLSFSGIFSTPTPGATNPSGIVAPIEFSEPSRLFTNSLSVTISTPITNADIYYTTDGSTPTTNDTLYVTPISIQERTVLNAVVFFPQGGNSQVATRRYVKIDTSVFSFDSNLPLVVIDTNNNNIPDAGQQDGLFALIEPDPITGRTKLTTLPSVTSTALFSIRGSSSSGFPKKQYKMELVDNVNVERGLNLLGLGEESDWILYAPGRFDRNMISNNFMYELARRMNQPGMNTQFIEVFLNDDNDTVSDGDYDGIYTLMESIKRDDNRIDIANLDANDVAEPQVTGGYILSIDRSDNNQFRFNRDPNNLMPDENNIQVIDPKNDSLVQAQRDYIQQFIVGFVDTLHGANWMDPETGYRAYMDSLAMAEYHMLNALAHNVDAFRLSGYYYKDRNGRLMGGPQWDFDRTLESDDGRDNDPTNVRGLTSNGTLYYEYGWWGRIFDSEEFRILYQDSWYNRRRSVLSTNEIYQLIDELGTEITEAYDRPTAGALDEKARWNDTQNSYGARTAYGGTLAGELEHLKDWLGQRLVAMDNSFGTPPVLSQFGGVANPGYALTLSLPAGAAGTIYYTTDGSDPRLEGGAISTNATAYAGPIILNNSTRIFSRIAYSPGNEASFPWLRSVDWSAKAETVFNIDPPASSNNLAIVEIHYNPYDPTDAEATQSSSDPGAYEFIELMNTSGVAIDLFGVKFVNGIEFSFTESDIVLLGPGERIVLSANDDAFRTRYANLEPAGQYSDQLGNEGESLRLLDRNDNLIQELTYDDRGFSDGLGHSLRVLPGKEGSTDPADWADSCAFHGTPTTTESGTCGDIVINEVLTHTDLPLTDTIELHNPTSSDIDIGYWLLSDSTRYLKYQIPANTMIPAGGYFSVDETHFNNSPDTNRNFALSGSSGDEVYLVAANAQTNLLRVVDSIAFRPTLNGESLGRFDNGRGAIYPMRQRSFNAENSYVRTGPVIISEIMYNPNTATNNFELEYVELSNIGTDSEDLTDWALRDGIDFTFPTNTTLAAGASLIVVGFDPAESDKLDAFTAAYGAANIIGPWSGRLNNAGETIWLLRADDPPAEDPGLTPLVEEERVTYSGASPWDVNANGTGQALARLVQYSFADTNTNWQAQAPSIGTTPYQAWLDTHFNPTEQLNPSLSGPNADADGDGLDNKAEYIVGTDPRNPTSKLAAHHTGNHTLSWITQPGRYYHVLYRLSLDSGSWTPIPGARLFGTGNTVSWTDTDPVRTTNGLVGYYLIQVE